MDVDDVPEEYQADFRVLREHAERGERPPGMTPFQECTWLEFVEFVENERAGYVEYDIETLFWLAKCGIRPPRMSPQQTADWERVVAEHAEHQDVDLRTDVRSGDSRVVTLGVHEIESMRRSHAMAPLSPSAVAELLVSSTSCTA